MRRAAAMPAAPAPIMTASTSAALGAGAASAGRANSAAEAATNERRLNRGMVSDCLSVRRRLPEPHLAGHRATDRPLRRLRRHRQRPQTGASGCRHCRSDAPDLGNGIPKRGDQLPAVNEMAFFGVQNTLESPPLERKHIDAAVLKVDAGRVAYDIHKPVHCMQAAKQIVVLAVAPRKEPGKIIEPDPLEAFGTSKGFERMHLLRADAIDKNFTELPGVTPGADREREHVPERKAEIIDQNVATRRRMPVAGIARAQQFVEI